MRSLATLARMSAVGARPPPAIIRLAPPLVPLRRVWHDFGVSTLLVMAVAGPGLVLVFAFIAVPSGGLRPALAAGLGNVLVAPLAAVLGVPVMLLPVILWTRWTENRRALRWRAEHPGVLAEPRAAAVVRELERTGRHEYPRLVAALYAVGGAERCYIVCDAHTRPPEAADALTEPVVVRPARVGRVTVLAGLCLLLAWVGVAGIAGPRVLHVRPVTALLLALAGVVAVAALHHVLWSRYVRFCPGRIEVLRYGLFGRRPCVAEFPLEPGTVVFLRSLFAGLVAPPIAVWRMTICRERRVFRTHFITHPDEAERLWQALLSRARAPELPTETL